MTPLARPRLRLCLWRSPLLPGREIALRVSEPLGSLMSVFLNVLYAVVALVVLAIAHWNNKRGQSRQEKEADHPGGDDVPR